MKVESGAYPGEYTITSLSMRQSGDKHRIELAGKVSSIEIVSHLHTEGRSGLGGAASGAVLGFLVAGPVGTLVGAGAGAGKTRKHEAESYRVRIVVAGHYSPGIMAVVSADELAKLYNFRPPSADQIVAGKASAEQKQLLAEAAAETSERTVLSTRRKAHGILQGSVSVSNCTIAYQNGRTSLMCPFLLINTINGLRHQPQRRRAWAGSQLTWRSGSSAGS